MPHRCPPAFLRPPSSSSFPSSSSLLSLTDPAAFAENSINSAQDPPPSASSTTFHGRFTLQSYVEPLLVVRTGGGCALHPVALRHPIPNHSNIFPLKSVAVSAAGVELTRTYPVGIFSGGGSSASVRSSFTFTNMSDTSYSQGVFLATTAPAPLPVGTVTLVAGVRRVFVIGGSRRGREYVFQPLRSRCVKEYPPCTASRLERLSSLPPAVFASPVVSQMLLRYRMHFVGRSRRDRNCAPQRARHGVQAHEGVRNLHGFKFGDVVIAAARCLFQSSRLEKGAYGIQVYLGVWYSHQGIRSRRPSPRRSFSQPSRPIA